MRLQNQACADWNYCLQWLGLKGIMLQIARNIWNHAKDMWVFKELGLLSWNFVELYILIVIEITHDLVRILSHASIPFSNILTEIVIDRKICSVRGKDKWDDILI